MGQYSLVISSAADASEFASSSALVFDDATFAVPVLSLSDLTGWARLLAVPLSSANFDIVARLAYTGGGTGDRGGGVASYLQNGNNDCTLAKHNGGNAVRRADIVAGDFSGSSTSTVLGVIVTELHYARLKVNHTDGVFIYKAWTGALTDEPATNDLDLIQTPAHTSGGAGFVQRGSFSTRFMSFAEIYVGTDGDPAPTGPVGGARRRSPLLLTPW